MSPDELSRLASKDFSGLLAADPVIRDLRSRLNDRKDAVPASLDAMLLPGSGCIGSLHVFPLTAAKWTFLWTLDSPFVAEGKKDHVFITDLDLFLYVLSCPDLRTIRFPLDTGDCLAAAGISPEQAAREIRSVIESAFSPLAMLPKSGEEPGEVFFDGAWLAWIASIAVRESGMSYDRVIHEMPLSLVCNFYVAYRRRHSADGDKIHRPQNGEIMDRINARVEELGQQFLQKRAGEPGDHAPTAAPAAPATAEDRPAVQHRFAWRSV